MDTENSGYFLGIQLKNRALPGSFTFYFFTLRECENLLVTVKSVSGARALTSHCVCESLAWGCRCPQTARLAPSTPWTIGSPGLVLLLACFQARRPVPNDIFARSCDEIWKRADRTGAGNAL